MSSIADLQADNGRLLAVSTSVGPIPGTNFEITFQLNVMSAAFYF